LGTEAEPQVEGEIGLCSRFQASLVCHLMRPCLKRTKQQKGKSKVDKKIVFVVKRK
jgi:hypothetical protein